MVMGWPIVTTASPPSGRRTLTWVRVRRGALPNGPAGGGERGANWGQAEEEERAQDGRRRHAEGPAGDVGPPGRDGTVGAGLRQVAGGPLAQRRLDDAWQLHAAQIDPADDVVAV